MMLTPKCWIVWFMDRYRGRRGLFGYLVFRADVRALRRAAGLLTTEARRRGLLR